MMLLMPEEIDEIIKQCPIIPHEGFTTSYIEDVHEYTKKCIEDALKRIGDRIIYHHIVAWEAATFLMNLDNNYKAEGIRVVVLRDKVENTDLASKSQEEIDEDRRRQLHQAGF